MQKMTPEAVAYARLLREQGLTFAETGSRLGVSKTTIRVWLDPEYAEKRRAAINKRRLGKGAGVQGWVNPDGERKKPTLAHVPGIEAGKTYCTAQLRLRNRRSVLTPHAALKKPRTLFAAPGPRLVHLGGGRVMFE